MSDCALFPASLSRNRVWSVWAGKESHLSLVDGAFTRIRPRVQPFPFLELVGVVIYGLVTVIHTQRIAPLPRFWSVILLRWGRMSLPNLGRLETVDLTQ